VKAAVIKSIGEIGIEMQRKVKQSFDPLGILNPGKVI